MSKNSNYIVIEGIDGSGKTTQFDNLLAHLGNQALGVREPGGTPMGEHIRTLLKDKEIPRAGHTNTFLFAAARSDLIDTVIRPAIQSGRTVLSDRNWLSTFAYQSAEGVDTEQIWELSQLATREFFEPDLLILIDVEPAICRERTTGRGDSEADYFETKGEDYYKKVRQGYLEGAKRLRHSVVIDGSPAPDQVWQAIVQALAEYT
jgi:dTMP kinase